MEILLYVGMRKYTYVIYVHAYMCVYMSVSMILVHVYTSVSVLGVCVQCQCGYVEGCACGYQRSALHFFLSCFPDYFLRKGLLLNLELIPSAELAS